MSERIKVVWICGFSNEMVRERLELRFGLLTKLMWKVMRNRVLGQQTDVGVWNSNAIREFEKFQNVELHVISPCLYLKKSLQEFDINGIHYHFVRDERGRFIIAVYRQLVKPSFYKFSSNRRLISRVINKIHPDVVHLIGAENPQYSLSLLDVSPLIPTIVQLQTLMSDPDFESNYHLDAKTYEYRSSSERKVLERADFLGTRAVKYINIIREEIKPNARFLCISLAFGVKIDLSQPKKHFDFVYFARDLEKAGDIALEAFGIAYKSNPAITLDLVGNCGMEFRHKLDQIIYQYDMADAVFFEGAPPTHEMIMAQIKKSRFALLPLRIDLASSTIREAMANGLPVLTTDTGDLGTRMLNVNNTTVLLSPKDDASALAENMLLLYSDKSLADELIKNAACYMQERFSNESLMKEWIIAYRQCIREHESIDVQ